MPSRVTIRDIAAEAGVHFTTVGLALRDSPRISASTREKVQSIAKKLGYQPDPMVSALNAYRQIKRRPSFQAAIAWINNWQDREGLLSNADFFEYHQGAVERAGELGYKISEFWLQEPGMNLTKLRRILKTRNIQGVIMPPQQTANVELDFDFAGLSAVALGYTLKSPSLHVVTNHHFRGMRLLLTHLAADGFKRIGLAISRDWDEKVGLSWLGGLLATHQSETPHLKIFRLEHRAGDPEPLAREIRRHRPDVIVSHRQVFDQLVATNTRIPDDISFANLSVEHHSRHISGIYQNSRLIGHHAVNMVVNLLHHGEVGIPAMPTHMLIDSIWNPGETLLAKSHKTQSYS